MQVPDSRHLGHIPITLEVCEAVIRERRPPNSRREILVEAMDRDQMG